MLWVWVGAFGTALVAMLVETPPAANFWALIVTIVTLLVAFMIVWGGVNELRKRRSKRS